MSDILYLMAADAEYGPALRRRITPVIIGVGPVEAAVNTARQLAEASCAGALPRLVVSLGSAGSASLAPCGLYQASAVSYRDMDATAIGFAPGVTPFLDLPAVLELALRLPGIPAATLSSGAGIVSGPAYAAIEAEMVDMETYAVLRACQGFGVPLIALRGISDGDAELGGMADWTRYLGVIDEKLAATIDAIEALAAEL